MTQPLVWGRGYALTTVSGTGTIDGDLAEVGDTVQVTVDHSEDADFALAGVPEFTAVEGITARLVLDGTDGEGFVVEFELTDVEAAVFDYAWTRAGIVE
jgi:hypothetical protein